MLASIIFALAIGAVVVVVRFRSEHREAPPRDDDFSSEAITVRIPRETLAELGAARLDELRREAPTLDLKPLKWYDTATAVPTTKLQVL